MRRFSRCAPAVPTAKYVLRCGAAAYHMPGWKTQSSTKDARSREQREADRKARQIEKLPRPEALHDFQYPYEKTVLSDSMFEYPVYESELDTPHLFNLTPPPDFFIYWNATHFERTSYPPVPEQDHRTLVPSTQSPQWLEHRARMLRYLRKHEVCPAYVPHVKANVNLSVVFPGQYSTRARLTDDDGEPIPIAPPETKLTPRNFWFTAHFGNYIELTDLQQPPSIFFAEEDNTATTSAATDGSLAITKESNSAAPNYYTLLIVSPDYPYRVPMSQDRQHASRGFFANYMVANLPAQSASQVKGTVVDTAGLRREGEVVIPYVAPLPTEDAGTTRHLCLLFKQIGYVPNVRTLTPEEEQRHFPLAVRSNFRLHSAAAAPSSTGEEAVSTAGPAACLASLRAVEESIPADPSAVTFFTTKWDIQVQEYYEKVGLAEPAAPVDEEVEALLEFHAMSPEKLRVRARHRADGSVNDGEDPHFWGQAAPTRTLDGSMQRGAGWSRRTAMGENGVPIVYPH